jgi:hypothetical protein
MASRPARRIIPTAKLTADNAGELELTSHRRAVASATETLNPPQIPAQASSPLPASSPPPSTESEDALSTADLSQARSSSKRTSDNAITSSPSLDSVISVSSSDSNAPDPVRKPKKVKRTTTMPSGDPEGPPDGSVIDVDDIDDPEDERLNRSDPTADIKHFFTAIPRIPGQSKGRMRCELCK